MTENVIAMANAPSSIKTPLVATAMGIVPTDFDQAWRMATILCKTQMIPAHFQNKPEETVGAILYGMEIGLRPIVALRSIAMINGRPCLWGDAIPAMIMRAGHRLEERIEGVGDQMIATCRLIRRDGQVIERSFSMADAGRAGLSKKAGPWLQYPQRMIQMRARSWCVRDGAADVLNGLQVAEEQQDVTVAAAEALEITDTAKPTKSAHRTRKDGDFERFSAGIAACESTFDLNAYLFAEGDAIALMPLTWQNHLSEVAARKREALTAPLADQSSPNQLPAVQDDDRILHMLAEKFSQCDSENEVTELLDQYMPVIDEMSPDNKAKALAILVVP